MERVGIYSVSTTGGKARPSTLWIHPGGPTERIPVAEHPGRGSSFRASDVFHASCVDGCWQGRRVPSSLHKNIHSSFSDVGKRLPEGVPPTTGTPRGAWRKRDEQKAVWSQDMFHKTGDPVRSCHRPGEGDIRWSRRAPFFDSPVDNPGVLKGQLADHRPQEGCSPTPALDQCKPGIPRGNRQRNTGEPRTRSQVEDASVAYPEEGWPQEERRNQVLVDNRMAVLGGDQVHPVTPAGEDPEIAEKGGHRRLPRAGRQILAHLLHDPGQARVRLAVSPLRRPGHWPTGGRGAARGCSTWNSRAGVTRPGTMLFHVEQGASLPYAEL